jgi:hypothetical protein
MPDPGCRGGGLGRGRSSAARSPIPFHPFRHFAALVGAHALTSTARKSVLVFNALIRLQLFERRDQFIQAISFLV